MDSTEEAVLLVIFILIIFGVILSILEWILRYFIPKYYKYVVTILMCCLLCYILTINYNMEKLEITDKIVMDKTVTILTNHTFSYTFNTEQDYDNIKIGDHIFVFLNAPPIFSNLEITNWIFSAKLFPMEIDKLRGYVIPINFMFP